MAGGDRAVVGLEKKVVLEMFSKNWQSLDTSQIARELVPNTGCN